ncbi:hypothetical protein ACWEOI_21285 [Nocardia sp. NPDC004340]|uniref:hypothetical protein n=1 Tax=Nocardia sp. CA-136227 TaxID=3239979 RepID=UPI003D976F80
MTSNRSLASASLTGQLLRGAIGFGSLMGALVATPFVGPVGLLLAAVGVIALRGCPACWAAGLMATMSGGRRPPE